MTPLAAWPDHRELVDASEQRQLEAIPHGPDRLAIDLELALEDARHLDPERRDAR